MSVYYEGKDSFYLGVRAQIIEDERDTASSWANEHIEPNGAIKWILGRYVEADNPNQNKQFWSFADLKGSQSTIQSSPLNLLHRAKYIVGYLKATEMIYPKDSEQAFDGNQRPYIEALAAYWRYYFPQELQVVQKAHDEGQLFFSMECISKTLTCAGEAGCGQEFKYAGPVSNTYCTHLNDSSSIKQFNEPHFLGAALIFPPTRPGWKNAAITDIARVFEGKDEETLHDLYQMISQEMSNLTPFQWEEMMAELLKKADESKWGYKKKKPAKQLAKDVVRKLK